MVHSYHLLTFVLQHRDVPTKEEQWVGRDHGAVMDEHSAALHHCVVDHEFVLKGCLLTVDRLGVELDLTRLGVKFWRPTSGTYM